jgi:hypothetical protein
MKKINFQSICQNLLDKNVGKLEDSKLSIIFAK